MEKKGDYRRIVKRLKKEVRKILKLDEKMEKIKSKDFFRKNLKRKVLLFKLSELNAGVCQRFLQLTEDNKNLRTSEEEKIEELFRWWRPLLSKYWNWVYPRLKEKIKVPTQRELKWLLARLGRADDPEGVEKYMRWVRETNKDLPGYTSRYGEGL